VGSGRALRADEVRGDRLPAGHRDVDVLHHDRRGRRVGLRIVRPGGYRGAGAAKRECRGSDQCDEPVRHRSSVSF
jgi:hypothetical protein